MGSGKVLLGVLAGVAVGATLGILFAPEKGSVARKKISKKGDEYARELEEKFHEFVEEITKKFEAMNEEAADAGENGKLKPEKTITEPSGAPQ